MAKIIHVTHALGPGAVAALVRAIHNSLLNKGHQSQWIALTSRQLPDAENGEQSLGLTSDRDPRAVARLRSALRQAVGTARHRTVVHAHLTWPFYYTALASRGLSVRCCYTEHNTHNRRRQIPGWQLVDAQVYSQYDVVTAVSQGTMEMLQRWLGRSAAARLPMRVIHNGIELFEPKLPCKVRPRRGLRLVSLGSLVEQKGYEVAIAAVGLSREAVDEYRIVGDGPLRGQLERLVRSNDLEDKVVFRGWRSNVEPELRWADAFLMPSHWEGFGLAAVEAMSVGIPGIVSDVPGLTEVVGDSAGGVVRVPPADSRALAAAIRDFSDKHENLPEIGQKARKQSEAFTVRRMTDRYEALYLDILGDPE